MAGLQPGVAEMRGELANSRIANNALVNVLIDAGLITEEQYLKAKLEFTCAEYDTLNEHIVKQTKGKINIPR